MKVSAFSPFSTTNFSPSMTQPSPFFLAVVATSCEVVARVLLELREGKGLAAVDDAGNVRGLLLGRAAMAQEAAADHDGREIRLQQQRLAQRLHHDHGLDRAGAEAAVVFRERQAEQALLGELAPDRLAPAALLGAVLLARLEVVGVVQQPVDAFLEKPLLLGQIKIHVRLLLTHAERIAECSLVIARAVTRRIHVFRVSASQASGCAGSSPRR